MANFCEFTSIMTQMYPDRILNKSEHIGKLWALAKERCPEIIEMCKELVVEKKRAKTLEA